MASRFDPYNDDLWNCWCDLCMALARAAAHHIPSELAAASDTLFAALEAGTHTKRGPRGSRTERDPLKYRSDGSFMREGLGIGMTPGGVGGSARRGVGRD